ncbi:hypothetical protein [Streptomyces sp. NPDC059957]|uniref:hypothetical protein n=1 Tax=unclassified Streptomyces TaxID=2593676 RepID=UPI00365D27A9
MTAMTREPHRPHRPHIPRARRIAVLTASAALVAAGTLLPSSAFAATPAAAPRADTTTVAVTASGRGVQGDRDRDGYRIRYCHWNHHGRHHSWGGWHCHTYWYGYGDSHGKDHKKDRWKDYGNNKWHGYDYGRLFARVHGL